MESQSWITGGDLIFSEKQGRLIRTIFDQMLFGTFITVFQTTMTEVKQKTAQSHLKPEWLRIPQVSLVFGIGRSKIYELIAEGKIKSVSLRKRGQTSGTRLISYDSLSDYIESQVKAQ
jgi:excisionase family DNA binding protein